MKIKSLSIKNFKAIDSKKPVELNLSNFNLIIGANGSGKSSVLQALHWIFQSTRNKNVKTNNENTQGSTLSEKDATYMPSPDYRNAGHNQEYGNFQSAPKLEVDIEDFAGNKAHIWIKSARNEGISVHIPSNNQIITSIRDTKKEFSAYIPGLAGIPLSEEKRSELIVHRLASAGDANTVLRNILVLLKNKKIGEENGLESLEKIASKVIGEFKLEVEFNEKIHTNIQARFQTKKMLETDSRLLKPLELIGIGYLQVIQIFAYLIYFEPDLLLVDEPDAHLHPTAQEKLVSILSNECLVRETQVIMTTHSPSVVRALPPDANVIWMKDGVVQSDGNSVGRNTMGWGLLDKKVLLMTEDSNSSGIRALISQWPHIDRAVAIWPFHGTGKLPPADTIEGLNNLFDKKIKIVIHRDRDFLTDEEIKSISNSYQEKNIIFWATKFSDIESYWNNEEVIEKHFLPTKISSEKILEEAVLNCKKNDAHLIKLRLKRKEANNIVPEIKSGNLPQVGEDDIIALYENLQKNQSILGKDLMKSIKNIANQNNLQNNSSFGKSIPNGLSFEMAEDLKNILLPLI